MRKIPVVSRTHQTLLMTLSCLCAGALLSLSAALTPALANMTELTMEPETNATSSTSLPTDNGSEPSALRKPAQTIRKDASICSRGYHLALKNLSANQWERLKATRNKAMKRNKEMPGKLLFSSAIRTIQPELKSNLRKADRTAKAKGRHPWLASSGNRWLIDRFVRDLKAYYSQPYNEYLCSGAVTHMSFLAPHQRKLSKAAASSQQETPLLGSLWFSTARLSMASALSAIYPLPLTNFAPADRPTARMADGSDQNAGSSRLSLTAPEIRPGFDTDLQTGSIGSLDDKGVAVTKDTPQKAAGSEEIGPPINDPDLPSFMQMALHQPFASPTDIGRAMQTLFHQLRQAGYQNDFQAEKTTKPLEAIKAAATTWDTIKFSLQPSVKRRIEKTLLLLEATHYLGPEGDTLSALNDALEENFMAIRSAHKANCACLGIKQFDAAE